MLVDLVDLAPDQSKLSKSRKSLLGRMHEWWLTWLTLIFIVREGLKFGIYVFRKSRLTRLTQGWLQNLKICTCHEMGLTWLTLIFLVREGLKFGIYVLSEKLVDLTRLT